jgi:diguanylate cyclase (GGDEF)-like protein
MHNSTDEGEEYAIWQQLILDLKNEIHALITANIVKSAQESFEGFVQATWCLPLISREMLNYLEDEQEFFRIAMERMTAFHIKQSYLFIFEQPVPHKKDAAWEFTQKLYLAAFQVGKQVTSYKREDRPCVNDTEGLAKFWKGEGPFCMQVYVLFSGEMQYGIMVTETSIGNIPLAYLASMQISNSLRFLEMSVIQRRTREKLEKLVEEINEKNEVLNFISEYDVLTDCLNRRGFMEAAMRLNKEHRGESASLIFMDVDHLKEINDTFGHKEGDFAIQRTASVLMEAVGGSGIVGRIGGDEFVAMILEEEGRTEEILKSVRESNQLFNAHSQKEYYIEASTGVRFFVCNENLMLSEILDAADMELYQSKKLRRKTIRKVAI